MEIGIELSPRTHADDITILKSIPKILKKNLQISQNSQNTVKEWLKIILTMDGQRAITRWWFIKLLNFVISR